MTTEQDEYALVTISSLHTKLKRRLESAVRAADWGNENWTVNCTLPRGMLPNPANLEDQKKDTKIYFGGSWS